MEQYDNVSDCLDAIQNAAYGEQVRGAIYYGISYCYTNISTAKTLADDATANANTARDNANAAAVSANSATDAINKAAQDGASIESRIKGYAQTAETKASEASTSASQALSYRNSAQTYASNASVSQTAAKTSEDNAKASQTAAKSSEDNAKASQTAAKSSEDNAKASQTAAKTSEDNAKASQTAAKTSEDNAKTYRDDTLEARDEAVAARNEAVPASEAAVAARDEAVPASEAAIAARDEAVPARDEAVAANTSALDAAERAEEAAEIAVNSIQNVQQAIADSEVQTAAAKSAADRAEPLISSMSSWTQTVQSLSNQLNNTLIPTVNSKITAADTATTRAASAATAAASAADRAEPLIDDMTIAYNDYLSSKRDIDAALIDSRNATDRANEAAESIEEMTVSAETVSPSTPASAEIDDEDGHKNIHFLIPKGEQGASFIIKGRAYETLSDLEMDISDPEIGDQYNVGTEPPYTIYRWTGEDWEDQGEIGANVNKISNEDINTIYSGGTVDTTRDEYLDIVGLSYFTNQKLKASFDGKVDKVTGKGLSSNDFTDDYKSKVDSNATNISVLQTNKVDKVTGKGLSTNDFTTAYKNKIDANESAIGDLAASKIDSDFTGYSDIATGVWSSGYFLVSYDGTVYKLPGSQFVTDLTSLGDYVQNSRIATMEEAKAYLGIS